MINHFVIAFHSNSLNREISFRLPNWFLSLIDKIHLINPHHYYPSDHQLDFSNHVRVQARTLAVIHLFNDPIALLFFNAAVIMSTYHHEWHNYCSKFFVRNLSFSFKSGRYCNIIFLRRNFTQWCEMVWSRIAARHRSKYVRDWDMLSLFPIEAWIIYHLWYPFQKKYLMTSGSILASIRASQPTMSSRLPSMLLRSARYTSIEWVRHLPFSRSNQANPRKLAARMPRKHSEFWK